jgi:hypothetical protein
MFWLGCEDPLNYGMVVLLEELSIENKSFAMIERFMLGVVAKCPYWLFVFIDTVTDPAVLFVHDCSWIHSDMPIEV